MRISRLLAGDRSTPPALPNFDSTTVFVRATASYLRGEEFSALGMLPPKLTALVPTVSRLPRSVRTLLYTQGGANEGVDPGKLGEVDVETFRRWVVEQYPTRGYPAVVVGSSNGAAVHLAAFLGVPWLPQTFLVPVRRSAHPDAIAEDLEWGRDHADPFLEANPEVSLHQMHDPNQDRRMVRKLAYFRTKSRTLGDAYEGFLETVLEPGGTVVTLECEYAWPAVDVGERHSFQVGGLGGLEPMEYYEGSEGVADFLAEQESPVRRWNSPSPDREIPEAEWGFEPKLREDVQRIADERDYEVRRLTFEDPRDLSPFVAELYRGRYERRDRPTDRLFAQSFALVEPWWTIRTGSVPYWSAFNTEPDAGHLEDYLESTDPYDEIWTTLFSHGVDSAGLASIDRWRAVIERARDHRGIVGVNETEFPYDVERNLRYHAAIPDVIRARHPHFPPMAFDRFESVATEMAEEYNVQWLEG